MKTERNKEKSKGSDYFWYFFLSMTAISLYLINSGWYALPAIILIFISFIRLMDKTNLKSVFIFFFLLTLFLVSFVNMFPKEIPDDKSILQMASPKEVLEVPIRLSMMFNYKEYEWDRPKPLDNATLIILKDGIEIDRTSISNGKATLESPLTNGRVYDFVSFKEGFYPIFDEIYLNYDLKPTVNAKGGFFGDANVNIDWNIATLNYTFDQSFVMRKIGNIRIMVDYMIVDTSYEINMSRQSSVFLDLKMKDEGIVFDHTFIFTFPDASASYYMFSIGGKDTPLYRPEIVHGNEIKIKVWRTTLSCVERDFLVYADDDEFDWDDVIRTGRGFEKFDMVFENMKPNILTIKLVC